MHPPPPFAFSPAPAAAGRRAAARDFALGIAGYSYGDLYEPASLGELDALFRRELGAADAALAAAFEAWRAGATLPGPDESELLIAVARHLGAFVARLWKIEPARQALL